MQINIDRYENNNNTVVSVVAHGKEALELLQLITHYIEQNASVIRTRKTSKI